MTRRSKFRLISIGLAAIVFWSVILWTSSSTPETKFKSLFANLSIGAPEYQTFYEFSQPADTLKGDFFALDLGQSDAQFRQFVSRLGVTPEVVLSSNGTWIKAESKLNPQFPWMLGLKAEPLSAPNKSYKIHIDGRQLDNTPAHPAPSN